MNAEHQARMIANGEKRLYHSIEPWRTEDKTHIFSAECHYEIAAVCNEHGETSCREDRINAERIVACVNACACMVDPEKEIAELRQVVKNLASCTSLKIE